MDPTSELERLRAQLAERDQELAKRDEQLAALHVEAMEWRARAEAAEDVAARLARDLERLQRSLTGPSSERVVDPDEQDVSETDAQRVQTDPSRPVRSAEATRERRRKGRGKGRRRRDIAEMHELPIKEFISTVEGRTCPCGGGAVAKVVGHDVRWRLEWVPGTLIRHKHVLEQVVFPEHPDGPGTLVTAPMSVSYALPRAMCGNRLLAQLIVDKYLDSLPLYRLEQRFEREGTRVARSTLCTWLMDSAELLRPLWARLSREVRLGPWLRVDAASMPVMDQARRKGQVHLGHMWAYGNYETVVFEYTPDKQGTTVASMLEDFAGVLLADGATDFNLVCSSNDITRAGCWAHARRKLYEALSSHPTLAMKGLKAVRQLFVAERTVMVAPVDERIELRAELCQPVLAGIRRWVDEHLPVAIPGQPMHAALQYIDNQWDRLSVFLTTAEIACHNNDTERDLRRPVKGKTNYLFAGSPRGAEAAAIFYTLTGTCLLQGIDPRRYLYEIFGRLDEPPSRLTPHAIREQWEADNHP